MNDQDAAAWGRKEMTLRLRDLANATGEAGLAKAQAAARKRKRLSGLTPSTAFRVVWEAGNYYDTLLCTLDTNEMPALMAAAQDLAETGVCVYYPGKTDLLNACLVRNKVYDRIAVQDKIISITYRTEPLE